jgi:hypothetical protein
MRDKVCRKILLTGWDNELGNDLIRIQMTNQNPTAYPNIRKSTGTYQFPITPDEAGTLCNDNIEIRFYLYG